MQVPVELSIDLKRSHGIGQENKRRLYEIRAEKTRPNIMRFSYKRPGGTRETLERIRLGTVRLDQLRLEKAM